MDKKKNSVTEPKLAFEEVEKADVHQIVEQVPALKSLKDSIHTPSVVREETKTSHGTPANYIHNFAGDEPDEEASAFFKTYRSCAGDSFRGQK